MLTEDSTTNRNFKLVYRRKAMQNQTNRSEKKGCGRGGPRRADASIDQETVLRELEKANLILQSDPELIDSMAMEEVEQEMKEIGIIPKPLPEKIISAISRTGKKPSSHNDTKGSAAPETIQGQSQGEAENEESVPKTRVAGAGGSNVVSIDKNKQRHSFVQTEVAYSRLPLIIWTAAVVVLTANIGPILHWSIGRDSNQEIVSAFSVMGAILLSALLTAMIVYHPLQDPRKIVSRSGFLSTLGLLIGGGIAWIGRTDTLFEATVAVTFSILGIAVILFLQRVASAFRKTCIGVLPEQLSPLPIAVGWSLEAIVLRFHNQVAVLRNLWQQCGMMLFGEGKKPNWAEIVSAGFLICAASGGIAGWQYQTSMPGNTKQDGARNQITAIQAGSSYPASIATGNGLKEGTPVYVGELANIVIRLPRTKAVQLNKETLAVSLNVRPEEIQLIDGFSGADLASTLGDLYPKETEPVIPDELHQNSSGQPPRFPADLKQ
jgi:hypothetical protein